MEKYILSILLIITIVGAAGLFFSSDYNLNATGAAFLSERLCQEGFTSVLYTEKGGTDGYFKPTVLCVEGDRVPALRERFELNYEENSREKYYKLRTDPYRFRTYW